NQPNISIIHLNTVFRAAHLIPVYGTQSITLSHPETFPAHPTQFRPLMIKS
ncbi:hypothetical protein BS17DRAFT_702197, partial [Gyrodon lividus]